MSAITGLGAEPPILSARRIGRGYWAGVVRRLAGNRVAVAAAVAILAIVLAAIFAPWIAPADPYRGSILRRLRPIGDAVYPLGSDELGRDMLSRLIYGGRLSLLMGLLPVVFAFCACSVIGIFSGFVGGRANTTASAAPVATGDDDRPKALPPPKKPKTEESV